MKATLKQNAADQVQRIQSRLGISLGKATDMFIEVLSKPNDPVNEETKKKIVTDLGAAILLPTAGDLKLVDYTG